MIRPSWRAPRRACLESLTRNKVHRERARSKRHNLIRARGQPSYEFRTWNGQTPGTGQVSLANSSKIIHSNLRTYKQSQRRNSSHKAEPRSTLALWSLARFHSQAVCALGWSGLVRSNSGGSCWVGPRAGRRPQSQAHLPSTIHSSGARSLFSPPLFKG